MRPGTLSTYAKTTLRLDESLQQHIGVAAVKHILNEVSGQADIDANRLIAELSREVLNAPMRNRVLMPAFNDVPSCDLNDVANPAEKLFAVFQTRTAEYRQKVQSSVSEWAASLARRLHGADENMMIAQARAAVCLHARLIQEETRLAALVQQQEEAAATHAAEIRDRFAKTAASIQRVEHPMPATWSLFWGGRSGRLLVLAVIGGLVAFVLMLARVSFMPYPLLVLVGVPIIGTFILRKPPVQDSSVVEGGGSYKRLLPQLQEHAQMLSRLEQCRRDLMAVAAFRELIDVPAAEHLLRKLHAVVNQVKSLSDSVPSSTIKGTAPDKAVLTGRTLAQLLWEKQATRWSTDALEKQLHTAPGPGGLEAVLAACSETEAATIMLVAAVRSLEPVTVTDAVRTLLTSDLDAQELLLAEFETQKVLLQGMLQLTRYAEAIPNDACPWLYHVGVPAGLKALLEPLLRAAFPGTTLNVFESEPDEIAMLVETFNWLNVERKGYEHSKRCLDQREKLARSEMWSSFAALVVDENAKRVYELLPHGLQNAPENGLAKGGMADNPDGFSR